MTNISKKNIQTKDYKIAFDQLQQLISKLNKNNSKYLLNELLTESERVMLTKRFAAIFMFQNNYSPYRVGHTLSISTSTANRLFKQYTDGQFDDLLSCIHKKEKNQFISLIEDIIMAQVSPRARARLMNRALS